MSGDAKDGAEGGREEAALTRDIQERIGQRLRSEFQVEAEKPTFLGESSVPPQFESLVRRLEAGERGERQGYEAVKNALLPPPFIRDRSGD